MATKKNTTKKEPTPTPSQEEVDTQLAISFETGKREGSQEVWKGMASFIADRMHKHFENRQDDLARELREILSAVRKNIT